MRAGWMALALLVACSGPAPLPGGELARAWRELGTTPAPMGREDILLDGARR